MSLVEKGQRKSTEGEVHMDLGLHFNWDAVHQKRTVNPGLDGSIGFFRQCWIGGSDLLQRLDVTIAPNDRIKDNRSLRMSGLGLDRI